MRKEVEIVNKLGLHARPAALFVRSVIRFKSTMSPILTLRRARGGQTGADRTALDWAIWHDIPHEGWCPKGRKAEDGSIGSKYLLKETPTSTFPQRTEWNVRDSDGTVIFSLAPALTGGSKKTAAFAIKLKKPWLHIYRDGQYDAAEVLLRFISDHRIKILNIAGPRASKEPQRDYSSSFSLAHVLLFLGYMQGHVLPRGHAQLAQRAVPAKAAHSAAERAAFAGDC